MELLDTLTVHHKSGNRYIELYYGDLTAMLPHEAVDVLVVSAFPNDYSPVPRTLIGALHDKGVSVKHLALKRIDLRATFSCWLSEEIQSPQPGIEFKRILCFEPLVRGRPSEVVGDIFQALIPFVSEDSSMKRIAMPLVATGNQAAPIVDILAALLDAGVHWLELGLPVSHIKIVEHSRQKAAEIKGAFSVLKQQYTSAHLSPPKKYQYDLFLSYSHQNTGDIMFFANELQQTRPSLRIFLDRQELNPGAAWQQKIFEALDDCQKVIPAFSAQYLTSKVCKEEFNIALLRHRDAQDSVLLPIYLYSAELPTYMKMIQFIDCREADKDKLRAACKHILASL